MYRLLFIAFLLLAGRVSSAQVLYGTMTGIVSDASGAVVPGATVKVSNAAIGQTRESVTVGNGGYTFSNLAPGFYSVEVSAAGFRSVRRDSVEVSINTVSRVTDVRHHWWDVVAGVAFGVTHAILAKAARAVNGRFW